MAVDRDRRFVGDYFTLQRGTSYKSRLLGQPGPVLLGLATIERNGGFRRDSLRTYGGESPQKLLVQPGELFLSLKDVTQSADLLGAVARLPLDHPAGRLTQDTVKLEPIGTDVPLGYLYWLLRSPQYREYCRAHATGTTNLGLGRDDFLSFPAPEPTIDQIRIADTLSSIEDEIELNRQMNETLEAIARALFRSWFVDFDPVHAKADGSHTRPPQPFTALFPDAFEASKLGAIPEGWSVESLSGLSTIYSGGTPSKSVDSYWDGDLPWISPKVMTSIHVDQSDEKVTATAVGNGTRLVPRGSVLIMVRGMGLHQGVRISQAQRDVTFNQDVKACVPKWGDGTFLLFALLDASAYLFSKVQASGHGTGVLPTDILDGLSFAVPPAAVRDELCRPLADINAKIAANVGASKTLIALRDTLLPKLVSGNLRIENVNQVLKASP